ncbi:MAG: nucleoside deaminase [Planctomycetota bacterium]|nr:nucleoside deaminase [Planctomycetota bacterium]
MERSPPHQFGLALPAWLDAELMSTARSNHAAARMTFAVELARRNVAAGTGGPFGAAVFDLESGRLVACGVNLVEAAACSAAHAEIVALTLAQSARGEWNLGAGGARSVLVSSVEPCAMCLGAIPWSGVVALECGAAAADAEAIGFDEGDKPAAWIKSLGARGIAVSIGILRDEATAVLREYQRSGGALYQPGAGI